MNPLMNVKNLHVHLHMQPLPAVPDLTDLKMSHPASESAERFSKRNDDATVWDSTTGLEWTADALSASSMTWEDAKKAVAEANIAGHSDWRLPTVQELLTLVDYGRTDPAINTDFFTCKSSYYWSSTPYASSSFYAWLVGFGYGGSDWDDVYDEAFVRAVRAPSQ